LGSEFMLKMIDDRGPGHVHTLVLSAKNQW